MKRFLRGVSGTLVPIILLLVVPAAVGQAPPDPSPPPRTDATRLALGYAQTDFAYAGGDSAYQYAFRGLTTTLEVSGERSTVSLSFGREAVPATPDAPTHRLFDISLQTGDDVAVQMPTRAPVRLKIPVRVHLAYQGVSVDAAGDASPAEAIRPLHLIHTGLGAGGRALVTVPGVAADVHAGGLVTVGGLRDVERELSATRLYSRADLSVELRLPQVFGPRAGLAVGYTLRHQHWLAGTVDVTRTIDGALQTGGAAQHHQQQMVHVGLTF